MSKIKYFEDYTEDELEKLSFKEIEKIPVKELHLSLSELDFPKGNKTEINGVEGVFYTHDELNHIKDMVSTLLNTLEMYVNVLHNAEEIVKCMKLKDETTENIIKIKKDHVLKLKKNKKGE